MTLLLLLLMFGQGGSGATIQGTIRDPNKNPVTAAMVYLQKDGTQTQQLAKSDKNGAYRFESVMNGNFRLRAEARGFGPKTAESFSISSQQSKTIDLVLEPAFFDEPQYTVAGVTDNTYRGGHGSDTVLRSSETLTKATASLGNTPSPNALGNESALRKLADAEPHSFQANYKLAQALVTGGKCHDALVYLQRALEADKSSADAFHLLGDANERLGNSLDAVRAYQTAVKMQPSEANTFNLGTELLTHLAPEAAIETFTKGHSAFPTSTRILLGLAASLYSRGLYEKAAQRFFEACDLQPTNAEPYLFMGKAQRAEIIHSEGFVSRMRRFVQLHPDDAFANYLYAVALRNQGNASSEVSQFLQNAVHLNPEFAAAYLELGSLEADPQAAIANLQKAATLDPTLGEAHYRLAKLYRAQGKTAEAKQELKLHEEISQRNSRIVEQQRNETQRFVVALRNQRQ